MSDAFFPPCPAPRLKTPGVSGCWCLKWHDKTIASLPSNSPSGPTQPDGPQCPLGGCTFSASSSRVLSALPNSSVPRESWNSCLKAGHGWSLYLECPSPRYLTALPRLHSVLSSLGTLFEEAFPNSPISNCNILCLCILLYMPCFLSTCLYLTSCVYLLPWH